MTDFFTGRGKPLVIAGSALALTGVGTGTAAAATTPGASQVATVAKHAQADTARLTWPAGGWAPTDALLMTRPDGAQAGVDVSVDGTVAAHTVARKAEHGTASHTATARNAAAHQAAAHKSTNHAAAAHKAAHAKARVHVVKRTRRPTTWKQIQDMVARQTFPKATAGQLPAADRLKSGPTSGPQAYLPITADRMSNAKTIVRQALTRHMGLRSAVIAVATAMQESTLQNISYGDRDSEGLFQQRPSAGWGSPAQITNPVYASDAFLTALHGHQQADPGWARQPLWQNAQAVQNSGFPFAYAKWESQAAQLVSAIARRMF
jgi:hypothetical protein